jgi:hypothetical protein
MRCRRYTSRFPAVRSHRGRGLELPVLAAARDVQVRHRRVRLGAGYGRDEQRPFQERGQGGNTRYERECA